MFVFYSNFEGTENVLSFFSFFSIQKQLAVVHFFVAFLVLYSNLVVLYHIFDELFRILVQSYKIGRIIDWIY